MLYEDIEKPCYVLCNHSYHLAISSPAISEDLNFIDVYKIQYKYKGVLNLNYFLQERTDFRFHIDRY